MTLTYLPHRAVIEIAGPDASGFLERVLTNAIATQPKGETRYTSLLTPQGKVIVDFLIVRVANESTPHFFLDVPASEAEALKKRLTMFRLRSDAAITLRDDLSVWHGSEKAEASDDIVCVLHDPRHQAAGFRVLRTRSERLGGVELDDWHQARIQMGLAEFGFDFGAAEVFPSDINMDVLGGIDLKKGCFVGQEVVSRMHRRGNIRKRTAILHGDNLTPGADVLAPTSLGKITSAAAGTALARLRLDRLAKADGQALSANDKPVTVKKTDWLQTEIEAFIQP